MKKTIVFTILMASPLIGFTQPTIADLLRINESIVHVSVDLGNGNTGAGTGVVVSNEYVATNCHVLANAYGANIAKYGDGYQPIAMKAD
jgi:S1-C subfamily serine protease